MARITETYQEKVVPAMTKRFSYRNVMQVPKLEKIIINMGLGEAIENIKILDSPVQELGQITGQKAMITKARRSIAQFKIRGRHADWMYGDIEEREDVRVLQSIGECRSPQSQRF